MMQRSIVLGLVALLVASGCREGDEPPPQFNQAMAGGGRKVIPTIVPNRQYDKSILGAAARPEDIPAAGARAAGPAGKAGIEIDDSTPRGIVQAFVEIAAAQNLTLLPDIVVPEQQEIVREMAEAMGPMVQAFEQLKDAFAEAFPGQEMQGAQTPGGMLPTGEAALEIADVNEISDEEAEATLKAENAPQPLKLKCKRIEDAWRIELPDVPAPEQIDQMRARIGLIPNLAEAIRELAGRISDGEFATAQEAGQALMQTMTQTMLQRAPGGAKPGEVAADEQPGSAKPDRPKERKREAVDEVISGPILNRSGR